MPTKITVLGTGAMGGRMATRLLEAGHEVTVYNRHPERAEPLRSLGARVATTPRAAAAGSEVVMSVVRDDPASEAVWLDAHDGALDALAPGAVAIESSTLTPAWVRTLAAAVYERGARFLDAPVVGSRPQAEAGQLAFLAGGARETLDAVEPLLLAMGASVHHAGPTGTGASMKLAVNASLAIQAAALGELLALLRREGLEEAQALAILGAMPTSSPAAKGLGALMAAEDFAPRFPVTLVEKDLGYALSTAAAHGAPAPMTAAARAAFAAAIDEGMGEQNISAIARRYR